MAEPEPVLPPDPLRHHRAHAHLDGAFGNDSFGRFAERMARSFGTPKFLGIQTGVVIVWIVLNVTGYVAHWDPYPFILLNLAFSTQAAYAAPFILLAQNRQAERERASEVAAAIHREEVAQATLTQIGLNTQLTREIHANTLLLDDIARRVKSLGVPARDEGRQEM